MSSQSARKKQPSRMFREKMPQVAVLLESSHEPSRGMLRGILRYVRLHGPWGLHLVVGGPNDQKLPNMKTWGGTGIIARIPNGEAAESVVEARLPTVLISPKDDFLLPSHPLSHCGTLRSDSESIGRMAADYYLARTFEHFACIGDIRDTNWSRLRQEAFVARVNEAGYECDVFPVDTSPEDQWWLERRSVIKWLKSLRKPVAIFAANDNRGRQVLDACMVSGIVVPYEAAVLGVNNDALVCETGQPPLSSVALASEQAGFQAAEMLGRVLQGKKHDHLLYGPTGVVSRVSTDLVHVDDHSVIKALEFIRINTGFQIKVSDVARHVGLTPRWLEKLFKKHLGFSILEEIKRVRMNRVRMLLCESDMHFQEISTMCGFESANHLSVIFKKEFGMTMTEYREKNGVIS